MRRSIRRSMGRGLAKAAGCILAAAAVGIAGSAQAAFAPGTLAVLRVGDRSTNFYGSAAGFNNTALPVFVDTYNATTGAFITTYSLPTTDAAHAAGDAFNHSLTLSPVNDHDGKVQVSSDGRYLLIGGYGAAVGTATPEATSAAVVNRVVARIDGNGVVNSTTALTDAYNNAAVDAVASKDGSAFYLGGGAAGDAATLGKDSGGLRYVTLGGSTSTNLGQTQTLPPNQTGFQPDSMRGVKIFKDQLYITTASSESYGNRGAYHTASAMPTSGSQTMIGDINNVETGSGNEGTGKFYPKTDIVFVDTDGNGKPDVAYTTGGKADYEKWSLTGITWTRFSTKTLASNLNGSPEIKALDAMVSGTTVTLFASTDGGVFKLTDTGWHDADLSQTFGATPFIAESGYDFNGGAVSAVIGGIGVIPVPEPTSFGLIIGMSAVTLLLGRASRRAGKGS